jgi:hypothetical protein
MRNVRFALLAMAVLMIAGTMVADDVKLRSSQIAPAAEGKIDYHHDRNGNTSMELKVEHLAEPMSLQPVKQVYVVWVQAPGQPPENQGVLKVNENLEGSIKMITKSQSFDVFVTAEDTPSVTQPSTMEVLRASVQNR